MIDEKDQMSREDEEQEIDLLELAKKLWTAKRTIIKWCVIGAVVGLVVAFSIPREYTTTVKLAPEFNDAKAGAGGLSSLASLAGINLQAGSQVDAVNPDLYPDVVHSVPFSVRLLKVKVRPADCDTMMTVQTYLEEETSSPWWGVILGAPRAVLGGIRSLFTDDEEGEGEPLNPYHLTQDESKLVESLGERIGVDVDAKTYQITISTTMQDPDVSAQLTDTVLTYLQEYVTDYRTNKARQDMLYADKLNEEARQDYYEAQQTLADYVDKNHGISLNSRKTEEERLRNDVQLTYNLYTATAQRLQQAKAKVQETTPVYAVVQPVTVPLLPSKPRKPLILVGFVFLAGVAAAAWILYGRDMIAKFKEN